MTIKGYITKVNFAKEKFNILKIDNKVRVKHLHLIDFEVKEGIYVSIDGEFISDDYGRVFESTKIEKCDAPEIIKNVLPIFITGIGEKKSQDIIDSLGKDYIKSLIDNPLQIYLFFMPKLSAEIINQVIEIEADITSSKEPAKLIARKVKGIGIKKATELISYIGSTNAINKEKLFSFFASTQANEIYIQIKNIEKFINILNQLKDIGFSEKISEILIEEYKLDTIKEITNNPYIPMKYGLDFEELDEIAINKLNFDALAIHRITSCMIYVIKEHEENGNTFANLNDAVIEVSELLKLDDKNYIEDIIKMNTQFSESDFIIKDDNIYRRIVFFTERKISNMLKSKITSERNKVTQSVIDFINKSDLSVEQKDRVKNLIERKIGILTGGPGTGKTKTIATICRAIEQMGKTYELCAPTGRASKRMTESTGKEARTIHRLLEYKPMGIIGKFMKNEMNPIKSDYVIVDEVSMVDVFLMNNLLKAISKNTSIIFVGDVNQLPSVSMGSILKDMKDSEQIYVGELTQIFRQSENSLISINANKVLKNEEFIQKKGSDFAFINIKDKTHFLDIMDKIISKDKPFQILCPMKNGEFGINEINSMIQLKTNKSTKQIFINNKLFKVGDKVIQLHNDYIKEVFNGEIGIIKDILSNEVIIEFPNNNPSIIKYKYKEMKRVDHSYAITIHKSQGSEFKNVIMIVDGNDEFLSKEIIYTGITRAKETLTILSIKDKNFYKMLKTSNCRATNLANLLKE